MGERMTCPVCGGAEWGKTKFVGHASFGWWGKMRGRPCLRCGWLAIFVDVETSLSQQAMYGKPLDLSQADRAETEPES